MASSQCKNNPPIIPGYSLYMPQEGPKAVPLDLDFSAFDTYTLDYSNQQYRGMLSMVATVWVDNYANGSILEIRIPAAGQTLKIPAGVQGYFPVICPNPVKMEFYSAGAVLVKVTLLNYAVIS